MVVKAVSIVLPAQLCKLALSLALQILIARLLMPEGRGIYGICLAISAVLLVLTYFGNEFGIRYLLVRRRITSSQAFRYLLLTAGLAFTASLAMAWAVTNFNFWLGDRVTWSQLALASGLAFSQLVTTQINVFMTINGQFRSASVLAIAEEALKLTAMIVLLYIFPSVEIALLAAILGNLAISLYSVVRYDFYRKDYAALRLRDLKFIYKYGFKSLLLNLSSLSNAHIGTLVLSGVMPIQRLGIYNLTFALIARAQVFPDALNRVLVPASMMNKDSHSRFQMVQLSVTALLAFCLVVVPILGFLGAPIMVLLFGVEYIDAGPIAFVLFTGFAFRIIGKPLEAHFNEIAGKPTVVAGIQLFNMTSMAILTYFGAVQFGLIGAAAGSALSIALGTIALFIAYSRSTSRPVLSPINFEALFGKLRNLKASRR